MVSDTMTPIQRLAALDRGESIDRCPIMLFHGTFGSRLINMSYQESESSAKKIALKETTVYRKYGCDNVSVNFGLYGLGHCLGSQFKESATSSASIEKYRLDDFNQMDDLDMDLVTIHRSAWLAKHIEALALIKQDIGQEIEVSYEISGPMTSAASLMEPEKILRATRKQPDQVHQLLRFATDCLIQIIHEFAQVGFCRFDITDPVSSGALMSPKQYREFSQPYTREIIEAIHQYERPVTIHICGDTTKSLPAIAATGVDFMSLDQKVDLNQAKDMVGDQMGLIGNVDPVKYFLQGTPQQIREAVKTCYHAGKDTIKGYFIGPGCSVPLATPMENVAAFMEASRECSRIK